MIDPVSGAIISAISANVSDKLDKGSRNAVENSYRALVNSIESKSGTESEVIQAIHALENKPDREGLKISLAEEVKASGLNNDADLLKTANQLLTLLKEHAGDTMAAQILASGGRSVGVETITGSTITTGDQMQAEGGLFAEDTSAGRDLIGRDQININLGDNYDLKALFEQLLDARGTNDTSTVNLLNSLREIETIHSTLQEWKELHNHLNNILIRLGQLTKALEKPKAGANHKAMVNLRVLWNGVESSVNPMINWASKIKCIHETPYQEDEMKNKSGPRWAIDIQEARTHVNTQLSEWDALYKNKSFILFEKKYAFSAFYENVFVFNNLIETNMFSADQSLRETAGDLASKSEIVLGSLKDVKI